VCLDVSVNIPRLNQVYLVLRAVKRVGLFVHCCEFVIKIVIVFKGAL